MSALSPLSPRKRPFYINNKDLYNAYVLWYQDIERAEKAGLPEPGIPATIVDAMMKISTKLSYKPNFINYSFRDELIGDALQDCVRFAKKFDPTKLLHKVVLSGIVGSVKIKDVATGVFSGRVGTIKFKNDAGMVSLKMTEGVDFMVGETIKTAHGSARIEKVVSHTADNPFSYLTTVAFSAFLRRIDAEKKQSYVKAKIISETSVHEFFESIDSDDLELQQAFVEFVNDNSDNLVNNIPQSMKRKDRKIKLDLEALEITREPLEINIENFSDSDGE
jgi:hypothetical protein